MDIQTEVIATVQEGEKIRVGGVKFALIKPFENILPDLHEVDGDGDLDHVLIDELSVEEICELANIFNAYLVTIGYAKQGESVEDLFDTLS